MELQDLYDYYEDEYPDLTDLIDVRTRLVDSPCDADQGLRCYAGNPKPVVRFGRSNLPPPLPAARAADSDAVVFGE